MIHRATLGTSVDTLAVRTTAAGTTSNQPSAGIWRLTSAESANGVTHVAARLLNLSKDPILLGLFGSKADDASGMTTDLAIVGAGNSTVISWTPTFQVFYDTFEQLTVRKVVFGGAAPINVTDFTLQSGGEVIIEIPLFDGNYLALRSRSAGTLPNDAITPVRCQMEVVLRDVELMWKDTQRGTARD